MESDRQTWFWGFWFWWLFVLLIISTHHPVCLRLVKAGAWGGWRQATQSHGRRSVPEGHHWWYRSIWRWWSWWSKHEYSYSEYIDYEKTSMAFWLQNVENTILMPVMKLTFMIIWERQYCTIYLLLFAQKIVQRKSGQITGLHRIQAWYIAPASVIWWNSDIHF